MKTKFFHYSQNNSGGSFDFDAKLGITHNVIVEALDPTHANARAEEIGLYFDGEGDCPCCGNRWSSQWHDEAGNDVPSIYDRPVTDNVDATKWMEPGKETAVHYLDGRIEWHS